MSPFNPPNPANPADHNPTHRSAPRGVVSVSDLSFSWPDGEPVFDSLSFAVSRGASGLVGAGGSGKSTLLRLLAGQLTPTRGSIHIAGKVAYLPQNVTLAPARSVEDVLGVSQIREALRQIEAGSTQEAVYGIVGENWDIEERTMAALASVGLPDLDLDRAVGSLSGGEATALALGGCLLRGAQVLLLDEPTNNLDRAGRLRVRRVVEGWRGGALLVVSHDRELLEAVERIGELRGGALTWYGGGWSGYRAAVEAEQAAALATLRTARATEKRQARERSEAEAKLAARRRSGAAAQARNRYPKIIAEQRKRDAQVSAGKLRAVHAERLAQARDDVESAKSSLRADPAVAIDLPATAVPAGRTVLELSGVVLPFGVTARGVGAGADVGAADGVGTGGAEDGGSERSWSHAVGADAAGSGGAQAGIDLVVRGPERIALLGANGTGKTTLVNVIVGKLGAVRGEVRLHVPVRLLPQRLDVLDDADSVAAAAGRLAPAATPGEVRTSLARFGLRGREADRAVGSLSGGERLRATLAAIMLAGEPPQLLILDEPTNSLDLAAVEHLVSALSGFRGALIAVSHDWMFLREIGVTRWLELTPTGLADLPEEPPETTPPSAPKPRQSLT